MGTAAHAELVRRLERVAGDVTVRRFDRLAAAHDASHYLLTPGVVVVPKDAVELARVLGVCRDHGARVTFRSGGTSLSGQASGSGVLIDTRRHFREIEVLDDGRRVRCQPGATVRAVNVRLARHRRKLGPDPASEIACTIGGVVANNSSGMACGTQQNTYRTLASSVFVLPSGTVVDTSAKDADALLRAAEPELHAGLLRLRDRIRRDPQAVATITALYSIKNTMGYGVNAFLDFERPVEILEHLMVGSEGTLGFVAEATFCTVGLKARAATALLVFPDLASATASLPRLVGAGFTTIELMDATSLRVAQRDPEATAQLLELTVDGHAALLVEFQADSAEELEELVGHGERVIAGLPVEGAPRLSTDSRERASLWHIRKGLFTAVAGSRPSGTTALLEDIAVPVAELYATCTALIGLFDRHGYRDCVIFGHAKDGNIHFMLNEEFERPESLQRYQAFTDDMVDLVLAHGGTLKAEHGTGRIMAPFVERQFGSDLYEVMKEVKSLCDPEGLLNPGVLISADPAGYVENLKTSPAVESEVDRCVECGYCEPACPSKDVTLTPRQRIVLRREIERARMAGDGGLVDELTRDYRYAGVETCAVDGMCETACPVLINTGDLVRRLRSETVPGPLEAGWKIAAEHWDGLSAAGGRALSIARATPSVLPKLATELGRAVLGDDLVPAYSGELPGGGARRPAISSPDPVAVYFASCTSTMFGPAGGGGGVAQSFEQLCSRAGVGLITPPGLPSLCCGTPWKSKGLSEGYAVMRERVVASLLAATDGGRLPVVSDASSCTEGLQVLLEGTAGASVTVVDAVEFVDRHVLPGLGEVRKVESLTLHPTCSSSRLGIDEAVLRVAAAAAESVRVPDDWGCCAFAGDRGMLHPELTAGATEREAAEVVRLASRAHASLNRTCELGMTRATGRTYAHILEVLAAATSPR